MGHKIHQLSCLTVLSSSIYLTLLASPLHPIDLLLSNSTTNHAISLPLYSTTINTSPSLTKFRFQYNLNLMVEATMGNPPQKQTMILDTGSELSWLQCMQSFKPLLSTSYTPIPCSSPICTTQTSNFPIPTFCDLTHLCQFTYPYADGTSAQGNLGTDTITLSSIIGTPLKIPSFIFGCSILPPILNTPGLMGLGRGPLSFITQLNTHKFSYCIADSSARGPGILLLGESPFTNYLHYTPLFTVSVPLPYFNRVAYSVRLEGIKVGNKLLPIPKSVFLPDHTGAGQTMVDSGTQFSFLMGEAYVLLRQTFLEQNRGALNPLGGGFVFEGGMDLCFNQPATHPFPRVSTVTLLFESRARVRLRSRQLLYQLLKGPLPVPLGRTVYCFSFGNSELMGMEANVIGNYHQQNLWVEYDLQKSRIGFARARCNVNS